MNHIEFSDYFFEKINDFLNKEFPPETLNDVSPMDLMAGTTTAFCDLLGCHLAMVLRLLHVERDKDLIIHDAVERVKNTMEITLKRNKDENFFKSH